MATAAGGWAGGLAGPGHQLLNAIDGWFKLGVAPLAIVILVLYKTSRRKNGWLIVLTHCHFSVYSTFNIP